MNKFSVALLITLLVVSSEARSEYTLEVFQQADQVPELRKEVRGYFTGFGRGLIWLNTALKAAGQHTAFCVPPALGITDPIIQSLIDQEIAKPMSGKPYVKSDPVEMIVLTSFVHRFPCSE